MKYFVDTIPDTGKLGLFTRDARVGDAVFHNNPINTVRYGSVIAIEEVDTTLNIYWGGGLVLTPTEIKKFIGEISPDALSYTNKGDEYDIKHLAAMNIDNDMLTTLDYFETFGWERKGKYIFVKGPCDRFH